MLELQGILDDKKKNLFEW
jgi:chitin synthase